MMNKLGMTNYLQISRTNAIGN